MTGFPSRDPGVYTRPGASSIRPAALWDAIYELSTRVDAGGGGLDEAEVQALIDASLVNYQALAGKGQPNGYAPLDPSSVIPNAYLPPLAITNTYVASSQAQMLALTAQTGDVCVRTDLNVTFILAAEPASVVGNWQQILAPTGGGGAVISVNGYTGVVNLVAADVGALTQTQGDARYLQPSQAASTYLPLSGGTLTGALTVPTPLTVGTTTLVQQSAGDFRINANFNPTTTGARSLGLSTFRWSALWAVNADLSGTLNVAGASTFTSAPTVGGSPLLTQTASDARYPLLSTLTTKGDVYVATAAGVVARLGIGADTQVLTADSTQASGVRWATPASGGMTNPMTTKGDLIVGGTAGAATRLAVGTDGQMLTAASAQAGGTQWTTPFTQGAADGRYVLLAGGSVLTGTLGPTTNNAIDLGTTALRYRKTWAVDGEFTNVPTVGGASLDARYSLAAHNHDAVYYNVSGDALTGHMTLGTHNTYDIGVTATRLRKLWAVDLETTNVPTIGGVSLDTRYQAAGSYLTQATADPLYANVGGDTFTGTVTVSAGGIAVTGASTFSVAPTVGGSALLTQTAGDARYLQPSQAASTYLPLAGGTLTGPIIEQNAGAGTIVYTARVTGDTQPRLGIQANGTLNWGPGGSTVVDTTLQRQGGGALRLLGPPSPGLEFFANGQAAPARIGQGLAGDPRFDITVNLSFDGTNWNRDNTGNSGAYLRLYGNPSGVMDVLRLQFAEAGANPATLTDFLAVRRDGSLYSVNKYVGLSPNANQSLQWLANGFYSDAPTKAQYDALVARVAALEAKTLNIENHYHPMGTWRQTTAMVVPSEMTVPQEAPAA